MPIRVAVTMVSLCVMLTLVAIQGCMTSSAMRQFDSKLPEGSVIIAPASEHKALHVSYAINLGPDRELSWSRYGDLELPNEFAGRCRAIDTFVSVSHDTSEVDYPPGVRTQLFSRCQGPIKRFPLSALQPEPSDGKLCRLPDLDTECAVVLHRSASPATDSPIAAYLPDGSRHIVQLDPSGGVEWLKLMVSPFLDIGLMSVLIVELIGHAV